MKYTCGSGSCNPLFLCPNAAFGPRSVLYTKKIYPCSPLLNVENRVLYYVATAGGGARPRSKRSTSPSKSIQRLQESVRKNDYVYSRTEA